MPLFAKSRSFETRDPDVNMQVLVHRKEMDGWMDGYMNCHFLFCSSGCDNLLLVDC